MILDLILLVIQGIVEILLLPMTTINIAIDFLAGFPVVSEFLQVIAYILPWQNLLPLFTLTIALFIFRIAISFIKTIWAVLPFL